MSALIVTNDNFIMAETDRYFSEHVAKHPVNTVRHAREPSGPDGLKIETKSAVPYEPKGFDKASLDAVRKELISHARDIKDVEKAFGLPAETEPRTRLVAAAAGWGGLPVAHAAYVASIKPGPEAAKGKCARMTLPKPPLKFDKGAFFSVTTYGPDSWIKTENFAVNNRRAEANPDGSVTFRFNCPGQPNNMDTVDDWILMIRLYQAESVEKILDYMKLVQATVKIEVCT